MNHSSRPGTPFPAREGGRGVRSVAVLLSLVVLTLALVGSPVTAQGPTPSEAVSAAVGALEQDGYIATFTLAGEGNAHGEVRFQSPTAYSLLFEDEFGAGLEYILLDSSLYSRYRQAGREWDVWERREWHPDAPILELASLHPRLPLEMLRLVEDLRDTGAADTAGTQRREIEGIVSYTAAFFASYEDVPVSAEQRQAIETTRWPLRIDLDPASGRVEQLTLEVGTGVGASAAPGTIIYGFTQTPPALTAPADAIERESTLALRPAPAEAVQALPLALEGRSDVILSAPFRTESGSVLVHLDPVLPDVQYRIWRIKRGSQLPAGFGAASGAGPDAEGPLTIPLTLAPGEYVVEIVLPEEVEWKLTIAERVANSE
jgi:hypothetical protein